MADEFPTVIVELFLSGPNTAVALHLDDTARGKLNTGTLGGDTWTDITDYVQSVSIKRGTNRIEGPVVRYEAGTCTIVLDNSDRRFDPTNLSGPYVSGGATEILPMRAVRVRASYNAGSGAVIYDLWRGSADSWKVTYDIGNTYSQVVLTATDGFKALANYERVAVSAVGAGEDTGARVSRILNSAGWPAADRVIAVGDSTVQATTLAGSALSELQVTADTEIGGLYCDGAGRIVFRNRSALVEAPAGNTFSDADGHARPYVGLNIEYDDDNLVNDVQITRVGGTLQTATDSTSQAAYLVHSYARTDLIMETDTAADDYAGFLLFIGKDPELRFASMTVDPRANASVLFPEALGAELGDPITIVRSPPGGGTITRDVFIQGISHDIRPLSWTTTYTLQSASRFSFLVLDDTTLGKLDSNALAF